MDPTVICPLPAVLSADTVRAAALLVGCTLTRTMPDGSKRGGRIVETEAYTDDDGSSHSFRGRTERNASMFESPGFTYVYLIYGIHSCLNVVSAPRGYGEAVLIRAIEPLFGLDAMREARSRTGSKHSGRAGGPGRADRAKRPALSNRQLCSGPGKLCAALEIDRSLDAVDVLDPGGALHITCEKRTAPERLLCDRRIGLSRERERLNRFIDGGSAFLSRPAGAYARPAARL